MLSLERALEHQATLTDSQLQDWVKSLPDDERINLAEQVANTQAALRKESALLFYRPVNAEAERYHLSTAKERVIVGGNRSSKSETQLVELVIQMTGIVPYS